MCDVFGYESSPLDVTPLATGNVKHGPDLMWYLVHIYIRSSCI